MNNPSSYLFKSILEMTVAGSGLCPELKYFGELIPMNRDQQR